MYTKLKLHVGLSNSMNVDGTGKLIEIYKLDLSILDKDERFDADPIVGRCLLYNGTTRFTIKSSLDRKFGGIDEDGLSIPAMDKLGSKYSAIYRDDMERYHYLKVLYRTLDEWANYWWGFSYDSNSHIYINEKIWEVRCEKIYTGSMNFLKYQGIV